MCETEQEAGEGLASTGVFVWELYGILWVAGATFVSFYGPQPLLPSIRDTFAVSSQEASLLLTLTIAPLGIAPLFYGLLLGAVPLRALLCAALALCACSLVPPLFTQDFSVMLVARGVQGLSIPAIALCLMTCMASRASPDFLQRAMSLYAAATMTGAYGGRILAGQIGTWWGWRAAFAVLAVLMLVSLLPAACLRGGGKARFAAVDFKKVGDLFGQQAFLPVLLVGPTCIFAHASMLNFLPFRMREIDASVSDTGIGLMYLSGLLCAAAGFFSRPVLRWFGSETRVVRAGIFCSLAGAPFLLSSSLWAIWAATLAMGMGFALMYTTMPGIVNRCSLSDKSVTNGVYLSLYYTGSALGSWVLVFLYSVCGLQCYVAVLVFIFVTALFLLHRGDAALAAMH